MDAEASSQIVGAYSVVWQRLRANATAMVDRIQSAIDNGETVNADWLRRDARYKTLQAQVEQEMGRFADSAGGIITDAQRRAVNAALSGVKDVTEAALGNGPTAEVLAGWDHLPSHAFTDLVGTLTDGSPLPDLLEEFGPDAGQALRDSLLSSVALGVNPVSAVQNVRSSLGGQVVRAMTVARTETLRAFRTSSQASYKANSDVVDGWIWSAAGDACAMCLAMDGTEHSVDETLDSHPNCRCAMIPKTKSWADLGFTDVPDDQPELPAPGDKFDALSDAQQLAILGPGKYEAIKRGDITLDDLVEETYSPRWGSGRVEKSLAAALEDA